MQAIGAARTAGMAEHCLSAGHHAEQRQGRDEDEAQRQPLSRHRGIAEGGGRLHEQRHGECGEQARARGRQGEPKGLGAEARPDPAPPG